MNSRLTREQVLEIRRLLDTGDFSQREIAEKFGISQVTVSAIKCKTRWKNI